MDTNGYKRTDWRIELLCLTAFAVQIMAALSENKMDLVLAPVICELVGYLVISVILYYVLDKTAMLKPASFKIELEKTIINKEETNCYLSKAVSANTAIKLFIILIITSVVLNQVYYPDGRYIALVMILLLVYLVCIFYCAFLYAKYAMAARGYVNIPVKFMATKMIIYYNPDDKRTIVDKAFGVGSTINLATRQGKIILWTILAIPLAIVFLVILVKAVSGK